MPPQTLARPLNRSAHGTVQIQIRDTVYIKRHECQASFKGKGDSLKRSLAVQFEILIACGIQKEKGKRGKDPSPFMPVAESVDNNANNGTKDATLPPVYKSLHPPSI